MVDDPDKKIFKENLKLLGGSHTVVSDIQGDIQGKILQEFIPILIWKSLDVFFMRYEVFIENLHF